MEHGSNGWSEADRGGAPSCVQLVIGRPRPLLRNRAVEMLLPSLAVAVVGRSIRVGGLPFVPYGFYSNGVHDASEWRQAATAYHNASALPGLGSQQVMVSELALPSAEAL
eukprot:COSAG01_NODE_32634_length_578_cov_0.703549_1_plen_109_part_01